MAIFHNVSAGERDGVLARRGLERRKVEHEFRRLGFGGDLQRLESADVAGQRELLRLRVGSQSSFTRFFQVFTSAGKNLGTFRPLWRWAMERLPGRKGGYSLDLDSTRIPK